VNKQHLLIKKPEAKRHPPHSCKAEATQLKTPFPEGTVTRDQIAGKFTKIVISISGKSLLFYIVGCCSSFSY
jgi:hypothetical protein